MVYRKSLFVLAFCVAACAASAAGLDGISKADASAGVKAALSKGADFAVSTLGKENGFLGNSKVKIPLPESLAKAEKAMRMFGMGKQADELVDTMNHAAESAVAQAKPILVDSINKMTIDDAKAILTGGDDSVRTTSSARRQPVCKPSSRRSSKARLARCSLASSTTSLPAKRRDWV